MCEAGTTEHEDNKCLSFMQTAQRSEAPLPSLKSILCKVKMYNLIHSHTHTHTHKHTNTHCIRRYLEQTASLLPEENKRFLWKRQGDKHLLYADFTNNSSHLT